MFGHLVLNEDITFQKIISTLLVLSGLALVLQPWRQNNTKSDQQVGNLFSHSNTSLFTNSTESSYNLKPRLLNPALFDNMLVTANMSVNSSTISAVTLESIDTHVASVIFGYILALSAGVGNAGNTVVLKKFSRHLPADVITFYISLGGCILSALFMLILEEPKWPNNLNDKIWLLVHSASIGASQLLGSWGKLLMPQILYYITSTSFIIFSLIGQYTWLRKINPGYKNIEELSGAVLVIFGVALPVLPQIISQHCGNRNKMYSSEDAAEEDAVELLKEEKRNEEVSL